MTTRRITSKDYDLLISRWYKHRDSTVPGTAEHNRALSKIAKLERFRDDELIPWETGRAWAEHGGGQ